ncbi:MAG: ECF transporter S component [Erysipelotrichales bacterium]
MKRKLSVKQIVLIGLLGSMAGLLMFVTFPLPFMPPFMSFDLATIPELIGGFILGPVSAVFIIIIKLIIKIAFLGTNSIFVGELQNFILSCAMVLPASIIYKRNKTRKNALIGMIVGTITLIITAILSNLYLIIPFYAHLYGYTMADVIAMTKVVNPFIDNPVSLVILGILPFNLFKGIVVSSITLLTYKRISVLFKIDYVPTSKKTLDYEL